MIRRLFQNNAGVSFRRRITIGKCSTSRPSIRKRHGRTMRSSGAR
jgi:hypothetical protein